MRRPVQVVEHEQCPLLARRGLEQRGHGLEQPVALGLRVGSGRLAQRLELGPQPRQVGCQVPELGPEAIESDRLDERPSASTNGW